MRNAFSGRQRSARAFECRCGLRGNCFIINGRKSKALFLTYFPKEHTLNFAPPDEELYLGP